MVKYTHTHYCVHACVPTYRIMCTHTINKEHTHRAEKDIGERQKRSVLKTSLKAGLEEHRTHTQKVKKECPINLNLSTVGHKEVLCQCI